MSKRSRLFIAAGSVVLLAIIVIAVVISQQRIRRHRVFRVAPAEQKAKAPQSVPPVEQWTDTFDKLDPEALARLLDRIKAAQPDAYNKYSLGYLHARALLEENELSEAAKTLQPFLDAKNPFHDLAIYHQAEIASAANDDKTASAARQKVIFETKSNVYRDQAIDEEADYLLESRNRDGLAQFITRVAPSADTSTRRELNARLIELMMQRGERAPALSAGLALLKGSVSDDAADRAARALDRPEIVRTLTPQQRAMFGDTMQRHRHFDRAVAFISSAIPQLPAQQNDLQFALGRSYFGAEKFAEAQQTYLRGASTTKDLKWKSTFLFHASRAVELLGDEAAAERLLTASLAVPGRFPSTTAAITQRIRIRAKQKRLAEAASDVVLLRKIAPNDHSIVEASLAYATGMLAAGNRGATASILNSLPRKMLDPFDGPEMDYWRARAIEPSDAHTAFNLYLSVLRSRVPTHYAYFARERVGAEPLASRVTQELQTRDAQVKNLIASKQFALAKQVETDRILSSPRRSPGDLERLASIYRELPAYRNILELQPLPLPRFPLPDNASRFDLLMAMGLYDEATDEIRAKYPLSPPRAALTQALALNRGSASRESIYAVEVLMKSVPADFVPDLLPLAVRQLLYPRYFYAYIVEDSKKYGTDPTLVLAIMREESRFNPRAKSEAAARGLLQFIITTAREIGRDVGLLNVDPEDLYDPRVVIRLGAKYVSELAKQFGGNRYRTVAAYNAGPKQVALWSRLTPDSGDDYFHAAINFDETKDYVRKVMNSYRRYAEIYGESGPAGGVKIEP